MMIDEQAFLHPSLTLSDVAERLHSNKTYVSKMVNHTYNMGFPEVLNILRIDYAEQYIISHRDATQEEIAKACGFLSASSLNSTFKRITGYTPKVWAARNQG
jgi:AraC-like DNA-binding protein